MGFRLWLEANQDWWTGMAAVALNSPHSTDFYDQLTLRDRRSVLDQQYNQYGLKNKEQEYENLVAQLASRLGSRGFDITGSGGSSWVHVAMKHKEKYGANWNDPNIPVQAFKTYRTFTPSPNVRVRKYLEALDGFAEHLQQLQDADPNYPDRMQYKFPGKLRMFFEHPDSLVVHFRNRHNRNRVEQTIDQYFSSVGVPFSDRGARATAGYDFHQQSHSEIISAAMEKLIRDNPQARQVDEQRFQAWLQQWLKYFNSLNPTQLWQFINKDS